MQIDTDTMVTSMDISFLFVCFIIFLLLIPSLIPLQSSNINDGFFFSFIYLFFHLFLLVGG